MSSHTDIRFIAPGADGYRKDHPAAAHPKIFDAQGGIVRTEPQRKKVAIVGFASSTLKYAPFGDPAYEVWGMNQLYRHIPRLDRHFDIHRNWREGNVEGTDHPLWIQHSGIPSYLVERAPELPNTVRFPIERVMNSVTEKLPYFTSTVAYMIALAIAEGFETIGIFGIDLIVETEYENQKQCVEFMLGIAVGRGVNLEIPKQCALLKSAWMYGYEAEPNLGVKLSSYQKWISEQTAKREQKKMELYALDGAIQATQFWRAQQELHVRGGVPTVEQVNEPPALEAPKPIAESTVATHEQNGAGVLPEKTIEPPLLVPIAGKVSKPSTPKAKVVVKTKAVIKRRKEKPSIPSGVSAGKTHESNGSGVLTPEMKDLVAVGEPEL